MSKTRPPQLDATESAKALSGALIEYDISVASQRMRISPATFARLDHPQHGNSHGDVESPLVPTSTLLEPISNHLKREEDIRQQAEYPLQFESAPADDRDARLRQPAKALAYRNPASMPRSVAKPLGRSMFSLESHR
jgi:hypothetical protein